MIFCSVELFFRIIVRNYEKRENPISERKYCQKITKFLHNVRASKKIKSRPKKKILGDFGRFLGRLGRIASVGNLPGIVPPKSKNDRAKLIFIKNLEDRPKKIQNFDVNIPDFFAVEISGQGEQISKVRFLARKH